MYDHRVSLPWRKLMRPRNWPLAIVLGIGWLVAWLPLSSHRSIARPLGWMIGKIHRLRHVTRRNIEACLPDLPKVERRALEDASLREMAASLFAAFHAWFKLRPDHPTTQRQITYEGLDHLEQALAEDRRIILLNCHLNSTELNLAFSSQLPRGARPMMVVYRAPSNAMADAVLQWGRSRFMNKVLPSTQTSTIVREIRKGALMWFAPDLEFHGRGHVWAPYFGIPAATSNSVARMAAMTDAVVLPMRMTRNADKSGFVLHIAPPIKDFPSGNAEVDAAKVNAEIEQQIMAAPAEYWWGLERFLNRPKGAPEIY